MAIYNSIGQQYSKTRVPDCRIVDRLIALLDLSPGSTIADLGAGTGGYSTALADRGFIIKAIEPSIVMQNQAIEHPQINWFNDWAENLSLPSKSVDGLVSTLAIHHFADLKKAVREMHRVVKDGAIVLLTFDIRLAQKIWLYDYFPFLWEDAARFLPLDELINLIHLHTHRRVEAIPFLVPEDLSDLFAAAAWKRPEMYLSPQVRAGISSFAIADRALVDRGVNLLDRDLHSGEWAKKCSDIHNSSEIDLGYRFIRATLDR